MPGLDPSDLMMFLQISDRSPMEIALRRATLIGLHQDQVNEMQAMLDAAEPGFQREALECSLHRSIERRRLVLVRLKMANPWSFWPFFADRELHDGRAQASYGYWQGYFPEPVREPLARRQWEGAGIAASVERFGLPVLRERFAILACAQFWARVVGTWCGPVVPDHFVELRDILSPDWWQSNLAPIAWSGGAASSGPERRVYRLRAAGHSWRSACLQVFLDAELAGMIGACLEKREARGHTIDDRRRVWPPVTIA